MDLKEIEKSIETWVSEGSERHVYFVAIENPRDIEKMKYSITYGGDMRAVASTMIGMSLGDEEVSNATGDLYDSITKILHSADGILIEKEDKTTKKKVS